MPTAVVIGSGPNGLSAAIALAEAGLDVTVHEEQETIGGGARSLQLTLPGFVHDVCSAIHPMGEHSPFLRLVVADSLRAGPMTVWRAARELLREDVLPDLHAIKSPTLLVWGEHDPLVPPSVGELFRAELPHARLELIAGAHHVPMVERPVEFCRVLDDFLT